MRVTAVVATFLALICLASPAAGNAPTSTPGAAAKKCFKKKHGKRVRVRCPKKKASAAPKPPPAPAPPSYGDPAAISRLTSDVDGQMLHHFSTNGAPGSFAGDERLYLCDNGRYIYSAALDPSVPGLTGAGKLLEAGYWRVTGAQFGSETLSGGLLMIPDDHTGARLATLSLSVAPDTSIVPVLNGDRWYLTTGGLCA